jgi:lysophospholipid acyltransferase (LPLAT)-like uncharacterized protein
VGASRGGKVLLEANQSAAYDPPRPLAFSSSGERLVVVRLPGEMPVKIRSPLLIRTAARLLTGSIRVLFRTIRLEIHLQTPGISPYDDTDEEHFIYCIWHDGILGPTFGGPQSQVAALTSRHTDGTLVAEVLSCVGITPIRGSSSRGGARAVKQMMAAADRYHIVIATDGPRGPRREVKDGIVYLAAQTGRAIVPVVFEGENCWRPVGKWTDLVVPKPFSQAHLIAGTPIRVPARLSKDERARWRDTVQQAMDDLGRCVQQLAAGQPALQPTLADSCEARAA